MAENGERLSRKQFLKGTVGAVAFGFFGEETFSQSSCQSLQVSEPLPFTTLGKTDLRVSCVGYGATRTKEPALVRAAMDKGLNFFDTGRSYANGKNEEMLGKVLKSCRQNVIIQSKTKYKMLEPGDWLDYPVKVKQIRPKLEASLHDSLQALQTDYIDILLFHYARSADILFHEEVLSFFENAKKSGKIRACGFSTHSDELTLLSAAVEHDFYDIVMMPYNHKGSYVHSVDGEYKEWDQPALENILRRLNKNKVGMIAMKTCSAGPIPSKSSETPSYKNAIRWVLHKEFIHAAMVAMLSFDEINDNLSAMKL